MAVLPWFNNWSRIVNHYVMHYINPSLLFSIISDLRCFTLAPMSPSFPGLPVGPWDPTSPWNKTCIQTKITAEITCTPHTQIKVCTYLLSFPPRQSWSAINPSISLLTDTIHDSQQNIATQHKHSSSFLYYSPCLPFVRLVHIAPWSLVLPVSN